MIVGLAGEHGARALSMIFGTLFLVWLVLGSILSRLVKGENPEILVDIPPYRIPYFQGLAKKLWMRMVWYFREAVPWVLFGVFIVNILHTLHIISFIGALTQPVIKGILGLPNEAVGALVMGFLRKDVAVGMLKPLGLTLHQVVVVSVVLTMYFPCVATFSVFLREFGVVDTCKAAMIMVTSATITGGLLHHLLLTFS
jgi:ferrous iron transport protein B